MNVEELKRAHERGNETPQTRKQKRFQERVRAEVDETFNLLAERFFKLFIMSDDPEGAEIADKRDQITRQWRVFCSRKNLIPSLHDAMDKFIKGVVTDYENAKKAKAKENEPANSELLDEISKGLK